MSKKSEAAIAPLTPAERGRGWVEYACPAHGTLAAGPVTLVVRCECGARAVPGRDGKPLARATLARLRRAAKRSADAA